jgi:hypothetical protein
VENLTGGSAPPHTWPPREGIVDVVHKALHALVTVMAAERLVGLTQWFMADLSRLLSID